MLETSPVVTASLTILLRQWRRSEPVELLLDDVVISHPSGYGGPWRYAATVTAGRHTLGVRRLGGAGEPAAVLPIDVAPGERTTAVVHLRRPGARARVGVSRTRRTL
jgi:hypothetical protein